MTDQTSQPVGSETSKSLSRLTINRTIVYFAVFIGLGLTAASLGPTLPGLAAQTKSNLSQISFLFTARAFGYLLGSLRGGRAFDQLRGHTLMAIMLLVMAVMMALIPVAPILWLLTVFLFILGLAEGTVDVGGNTLLVWVHQQRVGPYMNALHFFFGIGALLAPIIAAQAIVRSQDIDWVYWMIAIYLFPVALWVARLPSPPAPVSVKFSGKGIAQPVLVGLLVVFFFLYVGAETGFGGWIFTYATSMNLASPELAAYLTSIFWGIFTVGRLIGIPLATRLKPQVMLIINLFGCLISILVILLFPNSFPALALGTAGIGLSMASMFPSALVYAEQRMSLSGQVTSWFFVGAGAGGMVLPWLFGQLFARVSPTAVMQAIFLDLLVIGVLFIVIRLYNRRSTRQAPV